MERFPRARRRLAPVADEDEGRPVEGVAVFAFANEFLLGLLEGQGQGFALLDAAIEADHELAGRLVGDAL